MKKLKSAEEYLKETFGWNHETSDLTHYVSYWKGLIKQAQIDAIQIAVERCAEEARVKYYYVGSNVDYAEVNEKSILNVANKLKEELNETDTN